MQISNKIHKNRACKLRTVTYGAEYYSLSDDLKGVILLKD